MKKQPQISQLLFTIAIFIGLFSCKTQPKTERVNKNKVEVINQDFDWLIGNWTRINNEKNKTTFEYWEKKSKSEFIGFGYTMQNKDTIWQENIKLIQTGNQWSYDVTGKGEMIPTKFGLTVIKNRQFICENMANEFPKIIEYSNVGDTLHAKISGNGMEVLFDFEKTKLK